MQQLYIQFPRRRQMGCIEALFARLAQVINAASTIATPSAQGRRVPL